MSYVATCYICGKPIGLGATGLIYKCGHKERDLELHKLMMQAEEKLNKPFWKIW